MTCKVCLVASFFFFQAEDGIRDRDVTGVQTCALPILMSNAHEMIIALSKNSAQSASISAAPPRSEERRVGKSVELGGGRSINKKNLKEATLLSKHQTT